MTVNNSELYTKEYNLPERNVERELEYAKEIELKGILTAEEKDIYQRFVDGGFDVTNYKLSAYYRQQGGVDELDIKGIFTETTLRWQRMAKDAWYHSLGLNHVLGFYKASYGDKSGETEFWNVIFTEHKIDSSDKEKVNAIKNQVGASLRLAQNLTLEQAVILQTAGINVTSLKKLVSPRTPRTALEFALEEAEQGTTLTGEVVSEIVDLCKNGESSNFLDVVATVVNETDTETDTITVGTEEDTQPQQLEIEQAIESETNRRTQEELQKIRQQNEQLQQQIEQLKQAKEQEQVKAFEVPEGHTLLNPAEVKALRDWVDYWANKNAASSPRAWGVLESLKDLKGIMPLVADINVPEPVKTK